MKLANADRNAAAAISTAVLRRPSREKARAQGVRAMRYTVKENGGELEEIGRLIDEGRVTPKIARTYGLAEAASAQDYVEQGHTEGKVVLKIAA